MAGSTDDTLLRAGSPPVNIVDGLQGMVVLQGCSLWGQVLFSAGAVIITGVLGFYLRQRLLPRDSLRAAHHTIRLEPHFDGNMAWLEASTSCEADIAARIRFLGIKLIPPDSPATSDVKWRDASGTGWQHLRPDESRVIEIARCNGSASGPTGVVEIFTARGIKNGFLPAGNAMKCEVEARTESPTRRRSTWRYTLCIDPKTHQWARFHTWDHRIARP